MKKEKVIFRTEYDPYREDTVYLAIYPECSANPGRVAARPFYPHKDMRGNDVITWDCFCEIDMGYLLSKTRIVHKNNPIIPGLLSTLESFDDCEYQVCEKIMR